MSIERWIGSVINLSAVPCFGVCGNILAVSHNTPICTNFLQTAVLVLLTVVNVCDLCYFHLCCIWH